MFDEGKTAVARRNCEDEPKMDVDRNFLVKEIPETKSVDGFVSAKDDEFAIAEHMEEFMLTSEVQQVWEQCLEKLEKFSIY